MSPSLVKPINMLECFLGNWYWKIASLFQIVYNHKMQLKFVFFYRNRPRPSFTLEMKSRPRSESQRAFFGRQSSSSNMMPQSHELPVSPWIWACQMRTCSKHRWQVCEPFNKDCMQRMMTLNEYDKCDGLETERWQL